MINRDEVLTRLRNVSERVTSDGKAVASLDQTVHEIFPVAITATEGKVLRDWIVKEKVATTIEIGLAYGISALFICEGLLLNGHNDARHVAVDPHQSGFKNCGLQLLEEAGVTDLIEFHAVESQILLPRLLSEERRFELAFIDGSHLFERVFLDLIYLGRLVNPGGIIFVDDYQLPAIARSVSFCLSNLGWTLEELSPADEHHQWAVLRTAREPAPRTFRDFVDF
ncbi:MAG: class I SAM-dependent methyltransferase [Candidatus Obscuribacterales bacterium]|nr:class I SAM-dependent methyltransferase [Candidatus Obscuribacterales bacterium]